VKKFDYRYSILQNGVLTNSDGTNIKKRSKGGIEIFDNSWDKYLEDAIVPEITYTETNAVSVDKTVKAWTYYCDSLSGCAKGTDHYTDGDGSRENPWRSFDYALRRIQQKLTCWREAQCYCFRKGKYFQLKVKGAIDYDVGDSSFRGAENVKNQWIQQFIVSPWGGNKIVFDAVQTMHIYGTIFNNIQLNEGTEIYGSGDCIFNHTTIQVNNPNQYYTVFDSCHGTKFIDTAALSSKYTTMLTFYNCIGSSVVGLTTNNIPVVGVSNGFIYNAHVTVKDTSDDIYKQLTGFRDNSNTSFYNCSANVSGTLKCSWSESAGKYYGYVDAVGFYGNTNCTFYNCSTTNSCQRCSYDTYTCRTPDF